MWQHLNKLWAYDPNKIKKWQFTLFGYHHHSFLVFLFLWQFLLKVGAKFNNTTESACKEEDFWAGVSSSTIQALQEPWAYGPDFLMFQYDPAQYFKDIKNMCLYFKKNAHWYA